MAGEGASDRGDDGVLPFMVMVVVGVEDRPLACRVDTNRVLFWLWSRSAIAHTQNSTVARTIRFPAGLREKIAADAERCGRSFDGQVIALLRRHYGEDVDIAPNPADILALAVASLADIPAAEL
jgi:hypothetical protein